MDQTIRALRVSEKIADGLSIPLLKSILTVALHVAEAAEETRFTKERCVQLAERAARFTLAVYDQLRTSSADVVSTQTMEHVATLLCTLEEIEVFMRRQARKSLLSVLASQGRFDKDITRLSTKLEDAFRVFDIQTSLHTGDQLSFIANTQAQLLCHASDVERVGALMLSRTGAIERGVAELARFDGTLKLYGREDIDLIEELGPEQPRHTDDPEQPVVRYRALIRQTGHAVVVRKFPQGDQRFQRAVELSKRVWHPCIVQTLGFSRPDPYQTFLVQDWKDAVDGDCLTDNLQRLQGKAWMKYVYQCIKQLMTAFMCMLDHDLLRWPQQNEMVHAIFPKKDFVARRDGTLLWNPDHWSYPALPGYIFISPSTIIVDESLIHILQNEFDFEDIATLKNIWSALVKRSSRRCPHTCTARKVRSVGFCDRVWHLPDDVKVEPIRCPNIIVTWELRGPLRSPYSSEALPLAAAQTIQGRDSFFSRLGSVIAEDKLVTSHLLEAQKDLLPSGWRRHVVETASKPLLTFTLEVTTPWEDAASWFCDTVLSNDVPIEAAVNLGILTRLCLTISTGPFAYDIEPHLVFSSNPAIPQSAYPETLYYYENLNTPRLDTTFEIPLGYWSTDPDDYPSPDEIVDELLLREKRGIVSLGCTSDHSIVWGQRLNGMRFMFEVCHYMENSHLHEHEADVLREIRRRETSVNASSGRIYEISSD